MTDVAPRVAALALLLGISTAILSLLFVSWKIAVLCLIVGFVLAVGVGIFAAPKK